MRRSLSFCFCVALAFTFAGVLAGCGDGGEEAPAQAQTPAPPPPPPPPSADQLAQQLRSKLQGVLNGPVPLGQAQQMASEARQAANQYPTRENGSEALARVKRQVLNTYEQAYKNENWEWVVTMTPVVSALAPDDSRIKRYSEKAQHQLLLPEIVSAQVWEIEGELTLQLKAYFPQSGRTISGPIREGQELKDDEGRGTGLILRRVTGDKDRQAHFYYEPSNAKFKPIDLPKSE